MPSLHQPPYYVRRYVRTHVRTYVRNTCVRDLAQPAPQAQITRLVRTYVRTYVRTHGTLRECHLEGTAWLIASGTEVEEGEERKEHGRGIPACTYVRTLVTCSIGTGSEDGLDPSCHNGQTWHTWRDWNTLTTGVWR